MISAGVIVGHMKPKFDLVSDPDKPSALPLPSSAQKPPGTLTDMLHHSRPQYHVAHTQRPVLKVWDG
jgi:hypothetical protein